MTMKKKFRVCTYTGGKLTDDNMITMMTLEEFERYYDKFVREKKEPEIYISETITYRRRSNEFNKSK